MRALFGNNKELDAAGMMSYVFMGKTNGEVEEAYRNHYRII